MEQKLFKIEIPSLWHDTQLTSWWLRMSRRQTIGNHHADSSETAGYNDSQKPYYATYV